MNKHSCCACFKRIKREFIKVMQCKNKILFESMTQAMERLILSESDLNQFMHNLYQINRRDYIIASLMLLSGKHLMEVLGLQTNQVDLDAMKVNFSPDCIISIDTGLSDLIFEYISARDDCFKISSGFVALLFVTRNGMRVTRSRMLYVFRKASKDMGKVFLQIHS